MQTLYPVIRRSSIVVALMFCTMTLAVPLHAQSVGGVQLSDGSASRAVAGYFERGLFRAAARRSGAARCYFYG